jgi:hypothetical protein
MSYNPVSCIVSINFELTVTYNFWISRYDVIWDFLHITSNFFGHNRTLTCHLLLPVITAEEYTYTFPKPRDISRVCLYSCAVSWSGKTYGIVPSFIYTVLISSGSKIWISVLVPKSCLTKGPYCLYRSSSTLWYFSTLYFPKNKRIGAINFYWVKTPLRNQVWHITVYTNILLY